MCHEDSSEKENRLHVEFKVSGNKSEIQRCFREYHENIQERLRQVKGDAPVHPLPQMARIQSYNPQPKQKKAGELTVPPTINQLYGWWLQFPDINNVRQFETDYHPKGDLCKTLGWGYYSLW